ncbi:MAG: septum formation initiator family protein [Candidatus Edwardsbacteria bacterium]
MFHFQRRSAFIRRKRNLFFRKIPAILLFLVLFSWFIFTYILGNFGLLKLWALRKEERKIKQDILKEMTRYEILKRECEALESDTATIERVARETYGMIKVGETAYRIFPSNLEFKESKGQEVQRK